MRSALPKRKNGFAVRLIAMIALLTVLISLAACKDQDDPTAPETTAGSESTSTIQLSSQPAPENTVTMRVATKINVRSRPDVDAPSVAGLSIGAEVQVISSENGWSRIWLDGHEGYLPAEVLREPGHYVIVIDAGHQRKANTDTEAIGLGASKVEQKATVGAKGVSTGLDEYELNLKVALKLRDILQARGYKVMMIRTHNEVDISNMERAEVANLLYADAFIRIHASSDKDASVTGITTVCQTKDNPYNSTLYKLSRELSERVLDEMVTATGGNKRGVEETDTVAGINWSLVPVTTVNMGYMSNPEEDERMATDDYQQKLAEGIANGIDQFFG